MQYLKNMCEDVLLLVGSGHYVTKPFNRICMCNISALNFIRYDVRAHVFSSGVALDTDTLFLLIFFREFLINILISLVVSDINCFYR